MKIKLVWTLRQGDVKAARLAGRYHVSVVASDFDFLGPTPDRAFA